MPKPVPAAPRHIAVPQYSRRSNPNLAQLLHRRLRCVAVVGPGPACPTLDSNVVERCLAAVNALASYHFRERLGGRGGQNS
uniref:Uncharacterized protein n=1 Tax=Zea mays TaxID=4577 RepID=B4FK01_MAIZE|nr:unknown [Zea mays]